MQITTLGPLAVDGRPVRGDRLAAIVRELVEARGRAVTTDRLIEAVWGGLPPDDATAAIHALVTRARRLGLPVEGLRGSYRVSADAVSIDAVRARSLVDDARRRLDGGDAVAAGDLGDEARALFPAVPLVGEPDQLRLLADISAVRAEAALAVGDPVDEADLRLLLAQKPPHEPSAALLIRVLAVQGRDAEALEVMAGLRAELAERYGLDPSPAVTAAHLAVLRRDSAPAVRSGAPGPAVPAGVPTPAAGPSGGARARPALPVGWRRALGPLLGRVEDIAAVNQALATSAIVTVIAIGGAGKTRLATEIAQRRARTGEPVRVVELAGLRSPTEVRAAVLAVIERADPPVRATVDDRLRLAAQELTGLLVLDNCEHVLAEASIVVSEIVGAGMEVDVLATSRAPLGLVGEVVYRLRALPDADALRLLEGRARAGGATLAWDQAQARELCHRLDNLPLALELAAARLRHMPIEDVLAGLTDRFALLDDALRGLPDRHASLWAMVDWSRDLLAAPDRDLLQRLAVLPAPFSAEAASAVVGRPARDGLAALVEQSLLSLADADTGTARYRMLETVREYGEARLDADGDRAAAMTGLVVWARELAVLLGADIIGPAQVIALARGAQDQENLLAALRWAIGHDDDAGAVDIAPVLFYLWSVRGRHLDVVNVSKELLHLADPAARTRSAIVEGAASGRVLPDPNRLVWTLMQTIINSGVAGMGPSRLDAIARRALRRLLAERGDRLSVRMAGLARSARALQSADPDVLLAAGDGMVSNEDPYVRGFGHFARAVALENFGHLDRSLPDAMEAYGCFEQVGDQWVMGMAAQAVAQVLSARGQPGAEDWLRRSEIHLRSVGATEDARSVQVLLDIQLAFAGDAGAQARLTDDSGEPFDIAQARIGLAQLALRRGDDAGAVVYVDAVVAQMADADFAVAQARIAFRAATASILLRAGGLDRVRDAALLLETGFRDTVGLTDVPVLGTVVLAFAEYAAVRDDADLARELWAMASQLGTSVVYQFQDRLHERLTAVLGDEDDRERWRARWRRISVPVASARARELADQTLRR